MTMTAEEIAQLSNVVLDFHMKKKAHDNVKEERPTYNKFRSGKKQFPGGKGQITTPVRGTYAVTNPAAAAPDQRLVVPYSGRDQVDFGVPTPVIRAAYDWYEHHRGFEATFTELKHAGITVEDSLSGSRTSSKTKQEVIELTNLLEEKMYDLTEGWHRGINSYLWDDGTGTADALVGIRAFIVPNPALGVIGGIDRATTTWWRNWAATAAAFAAGSGDDAITSAATNGGVLAQYLGKMMRQLKRYGGKPNHAACGSDFIDALETELRANGYYSGNGYQRRKNDLGIDTLYYQGIEIQYEPELDTIGLSKRGYFVDTRHLNLHCMTGDDMAMHTPARPHDQYILFKSLTGTYGLVADQMNCHAVVDIT